MAIDEVTRELKAKVKPPKPVKKKGSIAPGRGRVLVRRMIDDDESWKEILIDDYLRNGGDFE